MLRLHRTVSFVKAVRAAAASALPLACSAGYDAPAGAEREAVIGGTVSGPEDDAVVRIIARQPEPYDDGGCTGVLLAPNVLLTALHCVSVYDGPKTFSCHPDGTLDPSWDGGWIGQTLDPASIEVYFGTALTSPSAAPDAHAARVFGTGATSVCVDDVALVVLDTRTTRRMASGPSHRARSSSETAPASATTALRR
jgi:hypothetical protein